METFLVLFRLLFLFSIYFECFLFILQILFKKILLEFLKSREIFVLKNRPNLVERFLKRKARVLLGAKCLCGGKNARNELVNRVAENRDFLFETRIRARIRHGLGRF